MRGQEIRRVKGEKVKGCNQFLCISMCLLYLCTKVLKQIK
ncbi:hypothetical protein HMPREF9151_02110 [Hoylesella saccharolytica F0055]|uniref:Uncharacterized protein n=1 Tax=Hoylesella saccharolytica F0055 TaxID=1127699 RepID=L1N2E6_9BACT|nr:hypothetical protein HMPREF9151_02110 [Hoylesella saccharolytica F0055]